MKKKSKSLLEASATCPAMYNQNVKSLKGFDLINCRKNGVKPGTPFIYCRLWGNRIKCWEYIQSIGRQNDEKYR